MFYSASNISLNKPVYAFYFQLFKGNENTYLSELRQVSPPIIGRRIRFIPYSRSPRTVCMRVEIYGCKWDGRLKLDQK